MKTEHRIAEIVSFLFELSAFGLAATAFGILTFVIIPHVVIGVR